MDSEPKGREKAKAVACALRDKLRAAGHVVRIPSSEDNTLSVWTYWLCAYGYQGIMVKVKIRNHTSDNSKIVLDIYCGGTGLDDMRENYTVDRMVLQLFEIVHRLLSPFPPTPVTTTNLIDLAPPVYEPTNYAAKDPLGPGRDGGRPSGS